MTSSVLGLLCTFISPLSLSLFPGSPLALLNRPQSHTSVISGCSTAPWTRRILFEGDLAENTVLHRMHLAFGHCQDTFLEVHGYVDIPHPRRQPALNRLRHRYILAFLCSVAVIWSWGFMFAVDSGIDSLLEDRCSCGAFPASFSRNGSSAGCARSKPQHGESIEFRLAQRKSFYESGLGRLWTCSISAASLQGFLRYPSDPVH